MKQFQTLKNGEKLAYLEQGKGDKTLLLVHGNLSSGVYYTPLLERIPEDIRVLTPDLRGFGDSTYNKRALVLSDYAEDLKLFLDAKGIKKIDLVGWSLGGGVAMAFAAVYPEMVDKLVLIASTSHKGYPIFKKDANGQMLIGQIYDSPEALAKDPIQVLPVLAAIKNHDVATLSYIYNLTVYNVNKPNDEDVKILTEEALKQRNLVDADWALANLNLSKEPNAYVAGSGLIEKIKCPVLHLRGNDDLTVPEYMLNDNVNALSNSTVIRYEHCGHSPFTDVPDQISKDILNFLK